MGLWELAYSPVGDVPTPRSVEDERRHVDDLTAIARRCDVGRDRPASVRSANGHAGFGPYTGDVVGGASLLHRGRCGWASDADSTSDRVTPRPKEF